MSNTVRIGLNNCTAELEAFTMSSEIYSFML